MLSIHTYAVGVADIAARESLPHNVLHPSSNLDARTCTNRKIITSKFLRRGTYARPYTLPVATRRKQKRCEPAFTCSYSSSNFDGYKNTSDNTNMKVQCILGYLNSLTIGIVFH